MEEELLAYLQEIKNKLDDADLQFEYDGWAISELRKDMDEKLQYFTSKCICQ